MNVQLGIEDGQRWGESATAEELERLSEWAGNIDSPDFDRIIFDGLSAYPIDEQVANAIDDPEFFEQFGRDDGTTSDPDYVKGFVVAALSSVEIG